MTALRRFNSKLGSPDKSEGAGGSGGADKLGDAVRKIPSKSLHSAIVDFAQVGPRAAVQFPSTKRTAKERMKGKVHTVLQSEASRQSPTAGLKAPPEIHPAALPPAMMTKPIAKPKYWLDLLMQAVLRTVKTSMKVNRNSTMST